MTRMEKRDGQSGNEIVPTMRKNSSAQTAAKKSKQAKERAVDCEQKHASRTFVSMRRTECNRRKYYAHRGYAIAPRRELTLQIPAKYKLFSDPHEQTEQHPSRYLSAVR